MAKPTFQDSRWIGRVLRDKWRIDARIARGGMGTVYAATHRNNGSVAAIKILHPEFSSDPDTRSRFLQEGYAANQVNHAGVVRILDDDMTEEGLAYLVMELLEGELLEQRRVRKGGRLPLGEIYELGDQLLDVLAAAHAKEIVHRDIKPDNIFLTREGRLKVLDFGFAQMRSSFRAEQTATGFLLGTPGFMAPEQAIGNRPLIDAQTDLWAVGATLFLLLTGEPVHHGESAAEMLIAAANYSARSVASLEPSLPRALVSVVDRALAFDKAERWPDARSMQTALRIAAARGSSADPTGRARWGASIPDGVQAAYGAGAYDETVMGGIARLDSRPPEDAEQTKAFIHPADDEPPTMMAVDPHRAPPTQVDPPMVLDFSEFGAPEATMIMGGRPGATAPFVGRASLSDAYPLVPPPPPSYGRGLLEVATPFAATAPVPPPAPTPRGGSRVLVLVLIGGITMMVVILTGLLVILGTD